ncbi:hypothetical protein [Streptomyces sp. NPDC048057]|uniref:hypothetical protein n=1 Tax=Streptomyces sp. NPDC048057 TaxID=3155628 RepID=UPI0033F44706
MTLTPGDWRIFADIHPAGPDGTLTLGIDAAVAGSYDPQPLPEDTRTARLGECTVTLDGGLVPGAAVGVSRDLLAELASRHGGGRLGDMVSTMAHSPAVLVGYPQLSRAMGRAKLDRRISERISITVQPRQGCGLCLDAHVGAARALGVDGGGIDRAREGASADPAIAGIVALALQVYGEPT